MMKKLKYGILIALFAGLFKLIFIEGCYALNFLSFAYHAFLGDSSWWKYMLSLAIAFFANAGFYLAVFAFCYSFKLFTSRQSVYFIIGLILVVVEVFFHNLQFMKIKDLSSTLSLVTANIFVSYFLLSSFRYHFVDKLNINNL